MRFGYLRDPLFLCAVAVYAANRWWIKPLGDSGFFGNHLNDLICIPFLVPPMLYGARLFRLRRHDRPPEIHEIVAPVIVWSILFEIVFPQHAYWSRGTTSDHRDILFYALGALGATIFWTRYYHEPPLPPACDEIHRDESSAVQSRHEQTSPICFREMRAAGRRPDDRRRVSAGTALEV